MESFFSIQNFKDRKLKMVENLAKKPGKERECIYTAVYSNMFATPMVASQQKTTKTMTMWPDKLCNNKIYDEAGAVQFIHFSKLL